MCCCSYAGPYLPRVDVQLLPPYERWGEERSAILPPTSVSSIGPSGLRSRFRRILLKLLTKTFLAPNAPLILLLDGTLERRWGKRIAYKGRFHDAVHSSSGHVQTSEGLHWLCLMLLVRVPWFQRPWALPIVSVPTLTPATSAKLGKHHRTTIQAAQVLIWLVRRWHPEREIVLIGDGGFAAASLGHTCCRLRVRFVSRLLLTAQLYDPVPPQPKGKPGVKPNKGPRQRKLTQLLEDSATAWLSQEITWYAG
jgi:DDE superfamily endonuclease